MYKKIGGGDIIIVYYKKDNKIKKVKQGYSWTTLFFGRFVPLFRLDIKWGIVELICSISLFLNINDAVFPIISIILWIVWANFYNRYYEKDLINKGYKKIDLKKDS